MNYNTEEIGKRIFKERRSRGWTQKKLGEKINVTGKQISLYENGTTPTLDNLLLLCELFECELGYLLGEKSYNNKTLINTEINSILGLNEESITKLMIFQQQNLIFSSNKNRKKDNAALNRLICTNEFTTFFECIRDLVNLKEINAFINKKLEDNYTQEELDVAFNAYQSNQDYERFQGLPILNDTHRLAIQAIDSSIGEKRRNSHNIKVLKYEINEALIRIIDEIVNS